jgi:hypothetical protein
VKFKIKLRHVVKPYEEKEFEIEAFNAVMAKRIFLTFHPEYDVPEWHIVTEKLR